MNYFEQPITYTEGVTSRFFTIAYLMANELYDAIEFGNLTTKGTISSNFIVVGSEATNQYTLPFYGPVTITFNPSSLNLPQKISKIEYSVDDGSPKTINSFFYQPSSIYTLDLPFPEEPGDPRNFPYTKTFYSANYFTTTYLVIIQVFQFGVVDPISIFYQIDIKSPNLDDKSQNNQPYFKEFHLISTRMMGPNNDILYTFETQDPSYIIPVLINWKQNPKLELGITNIKQEKIRPYKLLQPHEIDNLNVNSNIKIITEVESTNLVNDDGTYPTFRLLNYSKPDVLIPALSGYLLTQDGKHLRLGNYYNSNINQ